MDDWRWPRAAPPPDGHTMAMALTGMLSINPVTYSKAGFTAAYFTRFGVSRSPRWCWWYRSTRRGRR